MNEMKPEDVMRALECHSLAGISTCEDCPYCDTTAPGDCGCEMAKDALALLREKDAEIERLSHQCSECAGCTQWKCDCSIIRADAITEFAERLKTFYKHLPGNTVGGAVEYHIDQIAKEMREKV